MQSYARICTKIFIYMQNYMQADVKIRKVLAKTCRNMHEICMKEASATIFNKICNHMHKYAQKYAFHMQKYMQKYVEIRNSLSNPRLGLTRSPAGFSAQAASYEIRTVFSKNMQKNARNM